MPPPLDVPIGRCYFWNRQQYLDENRGAEQNLRLCCRALYCPNIPLF